ncbi:MAG: FtsX-like permease family protein [Ktedonobacteraceae bacterium]|nr:FtsX-like permease family protein [Ktedonobacteraceae bacterium]
MSVQSKDTPPQIYTKRTKRVARGRFSFGSVMVLAMWRWRQTGFLMGIITLGMIASIVIVCATPLFADVMNTAGLRSTLTDQPGNTEIALNTSVMGFSTSIEKDVRKQFDAMVNQSMGTTMQPQQFSIISLDFSLTNPLPKEQDSLVVYGTEMPSAISHLGHLNGTLPQPATKADAFEVLISTETAKYLKLKVGDQLPIQLAYQQEFSTPDTPQPTHAWHMQARIAGTFDADPRQATYWHGADFRPLISDDAKTKTRSAVLTVLVPNDSLRFLADNLSKGSKSGAIFSNGGLGFSVVWYYHVNPEQLGIADLDPFINRLEDLQQSYLASYGEMDGGLYGSSSFPYLMRTSMTSPLFSQSEEPSILELYRHRVDVARVPVAVLAIQIILLILFFVSMMTNLLVERQAEAIAILRSRGASSGQIFGALLTQCVILGLLALALGLPLAMGAVILLVQRILPTQGHNALNIISGHYPEVLQNSALYGGGILLVVLLTMSISLFLAVRMDVLAFRRESTRTNKRPLWQRLNLDMIAGILALLSYVISLYLTQLSNVLQDDANTLIKAPLSVVTPFFLILGCMLLFMRVFPLLLRLGAHLMSRGRGAVSMLALAQISRAPRMPIRMTMLLALATAFTLFTLVYTASETHHIQQITTYIAGADFGGDAALTGKAKTDPTQAALSYTRLSGVLNASSGFVGKAEGGKGAIPMEVRAVDASTFGKTVIWPAPVEQQNGNALLQRLISLRRPATEGNFLPVIIDDSTASRLRLKTNGTFVLRITGMQLQEINCLIVGVVPTVPTVNNLLITAGKAIPPGGVVMDYQTYHTVYMQLIKQQFKDKNTSGFYGPDEPFLNHLWLHTRDDDTSLATVRQALGKGSLKLSNLLDRRQLLTELTTDPLYLVLSGVLGVGTVTALLLALVGDLLASWLSARTRLTNFGVLRAIGTTPGEIAGVLTWEQVTIYVTGLALGIGFGALLALSIIPALTFTDLDQNVDVSRFYELQSAIPIQVVVPPAIWFSGIALIALFLAALILMLQVVSRPSLAQTLRLSED